SKRVASQGISMAHAVATEKTNSHRPGNRFTRLHSTDRTRSGSGHLHDQPSIADRSRGAVTILGSARVPRAGEPVSGSRTFFTVSKSPPRSESKEKCVSARRRNQHAGRVRSQISFRARSGCRSY